ncbi:MAG: hypothetical protein FJ293_15125 [Planctomycetes bacterium]|nr:hypothetical protein [Planctomycetota bacterium]
MSTGMPPSPTPPRQAAEEELVALEARLATLRAGLTEPSGGAWWPARFYLAYHVVVGAILGLVAAGASLLFNVVGALLVGKHPLQLIKVYLTFPLRERALASEDGFALSTGVLLYLATGMALGAALHVIGQRHFPTAPLRRRLVLASLAGVLLWLVSYYALLSWLQPLLFGGSWIVQDIPPLVAAATHLVFTWTLTLLAFIGRFEPPELDAHLKQAN